MPLNYVPVTIARSVSTVSATFGLSAPTLMQLVGSPFLARVYRVAQTTVGRDEAQPGTATLDEMQRLSVLDPACPVQVGDIAFLPQADGSTRRAKILRVRRYADRTQYDLETGAEGDASTAGAAGAPLPPTVAVQTQLDALAAEIGDLTTMFHFLKTGAYTPATTITASTTLTKPASSTTYPVDTTSGAVVITLYASTGDGTDLEFIRVAGTNPVSFVLNAADSCPLALSNTVLNNIGETQSFRELPSHVMEAH